MNNVDVVWGQDPNCENMERNMEVGKVRKNPVGLIGQELTVLI